MLSTYCSNFSSVDFEYIFTYCLGVFIINFEQISHTAVVFFIFILTELDILFRIFIIKIKQVSHYALLSFSFWVDNSPSRPNSGQREKKALKAFIKPFEAPQRNAKIKA